MTHPSKRGVPSWQDQLATSRQKKKETAARALNKEKYTLRLLNSEPVSGSKMTASGMAVWYIPYMPSETKWLSEEEATLYRLQGYRVTPYEKPPTPKWPMIDIEILDK